MELVPIVQIIQVHRILRRGSVVGQIASAQDSLARFIIVNVTAHGGVVFLDRRGIQRCGVGFDPGFEFRIARPILFDVILHCGLIEPERGARHRIVAAAHAGIARGEFATRFQREFLPQAREVQHAEWTGNAGADQGDVGIAHKCVYIL